MNRFVFWSLAIIAFLFTIQGSLALDYDRVIQQNITGYTATSPYAISYTGAGVDASQPWWRLFDFNLGNGNPNSGSVQTNGPPQTMTLDFGSANTSTTVNAYNMSISSYAGAAWPNYVPVSWSVYTSTDNSTFTIADVQITKNFTSPGQTRQYNISSPTPARYLKLVIHSVGANSSNVFLFGEFVPLHNTSSSPSVNTITVSLSNLVNGSSWPSSVTFSNLTGTLNFSYFNITGTGYCVTVTGNGTNTNCSTSGSGASTFYNVSNNSVSVTGTQSVSAGTYQALLNVSAYRLFLNTSISTYNTTNGVFKNASGTLVYALNGSNNVQIDVAGNYSKNDTCTVNSPLTNVACNVTGIYDDLFTIGGTNASSGTGIAIFSASMTNTTIGAAVSGSTTTGNVTFATLQGYYYTFVINATNFELANVTIPANASTNLYNFTLRTSNTFNFTIYNETTNNLITENVTLQIIAGDFAANYTFSGGAKVVELLTPGDYTITYWVDPDVPRNYYYTLTSQSYNSIKLYIIDESISNLYLPIILNTNTVPVANVTVQLLRDYIITGNTHAYSIVEMAKTDTNGQAVLRVVPNIVDYKLIITDGSNTLSTQPTKFTANTNTYTFNTEGDPTTSLVGYENIAKGLSWDNSTLTYTFTWADSQNIVSSGCLKVTKFKNGVQTTDLNSCLAGTSGSIAHTINDTNGTSYNAVATLLTSTQFSTLGAGSLSVSFDTTFGTFGIIGFIIAFIIFLTFVFVGGESGIAGALVSGFVAILIAGAFGFIASSWTAVVIPAAVIIGIIIYRLRS